MAKSEVGGTSDSPRLGNWSFLRSFYSLPESKEAVFPAGTILKWGGGQLTKLIFGH